MYAVDGQAYRLVPLQQVFPQEAVGPVPAIPLIIAGFLCAANQNIEVFDTAVARVVTALGYIRSMTLPNGYIDVRWIERPLPLACVVDGVGYFADVG